VTPPTVILREARAAAVRSMAHPESGLRQFIDWQRALSEDFDSHLPKLYQVDGQQDFVDSLIPRFLHRGATVYEVGGGKHPSINRAMKDRLGLRVIGLDISGSELAAAPRGIYDGTIVGDICGFLGAGDGDLIICKGVLEHVRNAECAFYGLTSLLKPGGVALIFVPSRNAVFSRLNRLLPERLKRRLLFAIFPHKKTDSGFPAWYDRCTPRQFRAMARTNGMMVLDENHYYRSSYFSFFFPLYLGWRFWVLAFRALVGSEAAETFTMALVKIS
jgi:2-polyprenyl-6-hydroxyphenyl methylase/3-demethylubiquinone-9 3-methyltransferase